MWSNSSSGAKLPHGSSPRSLTARLCLERLEERRRRKAAAQAQAAVETRSTELSRYRDDPVGWARDIAGYELVITLPDGSVTDHQARILRALVEHDKVAVRSGHKLGKSLTAVIAAVWWVTTRGEDARAVLTASTDRQVRRVLWRELRRLYRRLKQRGFAWVMPEPALDPATGVQWGDGREIIGFATKVPENAAGFSGSELLFILDEGSGIPTEIYEAFAGNMAGGAKMLALSNPTQTAGWFYEAFTTRAEFWHTIHLSYEDSPNYRAGRIVVAGLMTRAYVSETAAAYGEDSAFFAVRAAGNFPSNVPNAVIGLGLVEQALRRWGDVEPREGLLDLGVDVARFGDDDSVVAGARGLVGYSPEWITKRYGVQAVVHGYDSKQVAGAVIQVMRAMRAPGERVRIKVDSAGGYGSGVVDELRSQQDEGLIDEFVEIYEVNVAEASSEPEHYPQLRDELWFNGRAWLLDGGTFAPDKKLEAELIAPTYSPTRKGQFKVADKAEIKKLISRSPDRADALLLALYMGDALLPSELPTAPSPLPLSRWDSVPGRGF